MVKHNIALAMALSAVYLPPVHRAESRAFGHGKEAWQNSGGKRPAPKKR